jgi:hypothetical protein
MKKSLIQGTVYLRIALIAMLPLAQHAWGNCLLPNRAFDDYGPICWENEKPRLDNFAIALLNDNPTTLGHIVVYDGKRACRGEAIARAMRAKKYLVEYRKVPASRIVFRWGGYLTTPYTELVLQPRGGDLWAFLTTTVPLGDVTFIGNCTRHVRAVKCRAGW